MPAQRARLVKDIGGNIITDGATVAVVTQSRVFLGYVGVVVDPECDPEHEGGNVAVFFDQKVPNWLFPAGIGSASNWIGGPPVKENCARCPRVVYFRPSDLRVEDEAATICNSLFGPARQNIVRLPFPLVPNSHACQLAACASRRLATRSAFVLLGNKVHEVYVCENCHPKAHGLETDVLDLKSPLPGTPAVKTTA